MERYIGLLAGRGSDMEVYGGWESSGKLLLSLRNRRNVDYSNIGRQKKPSSSSLDQQHTTKHKFLTITASTQMQEKNILSSYQMNR